MVGDLILTEKTTVAVAGAALDIYAQPQFCPVYFELRICKNFDLERDRQACVRRPRTAWLDCLKAAAEARLSKKSQSKPHRR